jgi:PAB-dependent poly(A)-specific ribonuclease subunit 3
MSASNHSQRPKSGGGNGGGGGGVRGPMLPTSTTSGLNPYGGGNKSNNNSASAALSNNYIAALSRGFGAPSAQSPFQPDGSYMTDPSNVFPASPYTPVGDLFMAQHLRSKFQQAPAGTSRNTTVASSKFHHYTAITNIDAKAIESSLHRSLVTQVLRTTNRFNGKHVIIRRVVDAPAKDADCVAVIERLKHFRHPNLVPLHSITPTTEFVLGSHDTIMEYRMIKRAKSAQEAFFTPRGLTSAPSAMQIAASGGGIEGPSMGVPSDITEGLLWSIACQLIGLIRAFHDVGVPLRGLHLSKLMWLDVLGRIYFTGLGLMDVAEPLSYPLPQPQLEMHMKHDIQHLGLVLLQLATQSPSINLVDGRAALQRSHRFSTTFLNLVAVCLEASVDINSLCRGLGERMSIEVGHQEGNADFLLSECAKEVHNGRLMRLMIKLNFVLESQDASEYADASDRFTLKLFSQYIFNQIDEQNRPRVDWGHVYHSLNKLDCGSDELLQLISQDASTVLVVSYRDIRTMLDKAFELLQQPAQEMSFAGFSALHQLQQPASTPPSVLPPQ